MRENIITQHLRISIKAVALGFLTDIAGSVLCGIGLSIAGVIGLLAHGVPTDQVPVHMSGMVFSITSGVLGFGFTILGGYVAGRIAGRSEVLHGGMVGGVGIVLGLLGAAKLPQWCVVASALGSIPLGMLGGFLARRRAALKDEHVNHTQEDNSTRTARVELPKRGCCAEKTIEKFDYQHLDAITIEPDGPAVRLDYSDPDQGGTRLMIQFRIPISGHPVKLSGYAFDAKLHEQAILFVDIPPRVVIDARNWIDEQIRKAKQESRSMHVLRDVLVALNGEIA